MMVMVVGDFKSVGDSYVWLLLRKVLRGFDWVGGMDGMGGSYDFFGFFLVFVINYEF